MLTYFPAVYPDELLYSVLARYHRHTGARSDAQTMETLFGRRWVVADVDLPGALDRLAERIPPGRALHVDRILDELTLLPYYVAFQPPDVEAEVRARLRRGRADGLHLKLGLAAFRPGRVTRLRFCRPCLEDMSARHGEAYWRRVHQLPSVLVCPDHGTALQESTVLLLGHSRHGYAVPSNETCPPNARPLVTGAVPPRVLLRIAKASAVLLEDPGQARSPIEWAAHYRARMEAAGLAYSTRRMNLVELDLGLRRHMGAALQAFPGVMDGDRFAGDWPVVLLHRHRKAMHPLFHLLLQDFLAERGPQKRPFGQGPWPCLNPLHRHVKVGSVVLKDIHRNHGHTVGVFVCTCGFVYTRSYQPDTTRLGPPKFQVYGPLLVPAVCRFLREHQSLREIARRLKLDPKTVVRLARAEGVNAPWTPRRSAVPAASRPRAVRQCTHNDRVIRGRTTHPGAARVDWPRRDRTLVEQVSRAAARIRASQPPVRVTSAQIERQLGMRDWIAKRHTKLPLTASCLAQMVEPLEAFQRRRAAWITDEMDCDGAVLSPWRVMRRAGLTAKHLAMIESVLTRRTRGSGGAA
jgi:hypothetical protein